jgi:Uma2 family endonuclease
MAEHHIASSLAKAAGTGGEIVSASDYMERYAHASYEWVEGRIIKMAPVSLLHNLIVGYLRDLLRAYFSLNPIGQVIDHPFVMRLDSTESRREPDLSQPIPAS